MSIKKPVRSVLTVNLRALSNESRQFHITTHPRNRYLLLTIDFIKFLLYGCRFETCLQEEWQFGYLDDTSVSSRVTGSGLGIYDSDSEVYRSVDSDLEVYPTVDLEPEVYRIVDLYPEVYPSVEVYRTVDLYPEVYPSVDPGFRVYPSFYDYINLRLVLRGYNPQVFLRNPMYPYEDRYLLEAFVDSAVPSSYYHLNQRLGLVGFGGNPIVLFRL